MKEEIVRREPEPEWEEKLQDKIENNQQDANQRQQSFAMCKKIGEPVE
jgi:hypothetical protein